MGPAFDTLLFTSGLILVWSFLSTMRRKKHYDVIAEPLRLVLSWALFLLAFMLLRSDLLRTEDAEESVCNSSWWHHVLFIGNFMDPDYTVSIFFKTNFNQIIFIFSVCRKLGT